MKYDYITIEPKYLRGFPEPMGWGVFGHGTYGPESILEGTHKRVFLDSFPTDGEAMASYPEARLSGSTRQNVNPLPATPPAWFDAGAAGERWDDDY